MEPFSSFKKSSFITGATLAVSALFPAAEKVEAALPQKPNIMFIMADDLGARTVKCYNSPYYSGIQTPNIDALAANGLRFETAWATPVCTPSRASLLTGRYGYRTGWTGLPTETVYGGTLPPELILEGRHLSIGNIMKCAGYSTFVAGKWMLSGSTQNFSNQISTLGFDEHCIWPNTTSFLPPNSGYTGETGKVSRYWNPVYVKNGKYLPATANDYGPDMIQEFMLDCCKKSKERNQPFFAYYTTTLPHDPYDSTPDPNNPGKKIAGSLKASVEYLDYQVGRVVAELEANGMRENTIIIFCGDNGTHGEGKWSLARESGARVPLIVNWPGHVRKGVSRELMDFADLMPTFAEIAGASSILNGYTIDGKSIVPHFTDSTAIGKEWIHYVYDGRGLRDKRWLLDGQNAFWDCGDSRNENNYKKIDTTTLNTNADAAAAYAKFKAIFANMDSNTLKPLETPPTCQNSRSETASNSQRTLSGISVLVQGSRVSFLPNLTGPYSMEIFDLRGRRVKNEIHWNSGSHFETVKSSGCYAVKIRAGETKTLYSHFVIF